MDAKRNVKKEADGTWGANVWFGPYDNSTDFRRYFYRTREQARNADISHAIGDGSGKIDSGPYQD